MIPPAASYACLALGPGVMATIANAIEEHFNTNQCIRIVLALLGGKSIDRFVTYIMPSVLGDPA